MSEPVTQAEIEDVLSSIRRLVSEDSRSDGAAVQLRQAHSESAELTGSDPASAEEAVSSLPPKSATRLVLTPALRVPETPDQEDASQESSGTQVQETVSEMSQADENRDAVSLDASAELLAADINDETGASEDPIAQATSNSTDQDEAPWKDPWATLYQAAGVATGEEDDDFLSPTLHSVGAAPVDRVSAVVQKITELEARVARSKQQWEPDAPTADPFAGSNIETLQWRDHDDAADIEPEPDTAAGEDVASEEEQVLFRHPGLGHMDTAAPQQDPEEPDLVAAAVQTAEEDLTSQALETLAGEDAYIDEESLRELVADIVREELQGALGERITRNVRKLVRREIHRALAAQDLL